MKKYSEYILLSTLTQKLKDKDYYQTFAKSLLMTNMPEARLPEKNKLVENMLLFFIENNNLPIYYKKAPVSIDEVKSEAQRRDLENSSSPSEKNTTFEFIWKNEIYLKAEELKKLYANKCIVLPKSLLVECSQR